MEYFIGLLLPPIIDYFNRTVYNGVERTVVTVILCTVVAIILDHSVLTNVTWNNAQSVLLLASAITGEATTVYNVWWKNSAVRAVLPGNGVDPIQRG